MTDVNRRGFLRMLGLGAAAAITPTKTYAFFGNILRPRPTWEDSEYDVIADIKAMKDKIRADTGLQVCITKVLCSKDMIMKFTVDDKGIQIDEELAFAPEHRTFPKTAEAAPAIIKWPAKMSKYFQVKAGQQIEIFRDSPIRYAPAIDMEGNVHL